MARSIDSFKTELQKIRTGGGAHPGILYQVHVDYYGRWFRQPGCERHPARTRARSAWQPWEKGMGA